MRHPRIQSLTFTAGLAFGLFALVAAGSTIWLAVQMRTSTAVMERAVESRDVLEDLERALLVRSRYANIALATGEPERMRRVAELDVEIEALIGRAAELAGDDPLDLRLVEEVRVTRKRYLEQRARSAAGVEPVSATIAAVRVDFDAMMDALTELRSQNEAEVAAARATAAELTRTAWTLGFVVVGLVVIGIVVLLVAVRRHVVAPLMSLRAIVSRWRAGEPREDVPERGPREIVDIADAFNAMSAELARQREAQLTFLAGVAHDLRNPLNGLSLAAAAMRDMPGSDEPTHARVVALVERQVSHLDRMVGDLLDVTRIEAGQLTLEPRRIDLRATVASVAELYAPTALDHPIRVCLPNEPVLVQGDPVRIEQVVGNLVSNAIKYSPSGSEVGVELASDRGEAWIDVVDQGDGIPEDELASIFEPFRRRRASKDAAPGAGLGLSIVRRVVEAHRGCIDVSSAPGRGARFRVRLPLDDRSGASAAAEHGAAPAPDVRAA